MGLVLCNLQKLFLIQLGVIMELWLCPGDHQFWGICAEVSLGYLRLLFRCYMHQDVYNLLFNGSAMTDTCVHTHIYGKMLTSFEFRW